MWWFFLHRHLGGLMILTRFSMLFVKVLLLFLFLHRHSSFISFLFHHRFNMGHWLILDMSILKVGCGYETLFLEFVLHSHRCLSPQAIKWHDRTYSHQIGFQCRMLWFEVAVLELPMKNIPFPQPSVARFIMFSLLVHDGHGQRWLTAIRILFRSAHISFNGRSPSWSNILNDIARTSHRKCHTDISMAGKIASEISQLTVDWSFLLPSQKALDSLSTWK